MVNPSQSYRVSFHIESHVATCHETQMNMPRSNPSQTD